MLGRTLETPTVHPIQTSHQQLKAAGACPNRLGLGRQRRRFRQGHILPGGGQGLGGGLELVLQGTDAIEDFRGLGLKAIAQHLHHRIALIEIGEHGGSCHRLNAANASRHP